MRMRPSGHLRQSDRLRRRWTRPQLEAMEDRLLLTTFQVNNTLDDSNTGSLRWAIGQTNAAGGGDTIQFVIGGGGGKNLNKPPGLPPLGKPRRRDGTPPP